MSFFFHNFSTLLASYSYFYLLFFFFLLPMCIYLYTVFLRHFSFLISYTNESNGQIFHVYNQGKKILSFKCIIL